jgi:hypothetical protein
MLSQAKQLLLADALYYLKMKELRKACVLLSLPSNGKKIELITRITTFLKTGKITQLPSMPANSQAKNHAAQPLKADALVLYGGYKNDAKTRAFFKALIGPHFHFTAFGIDWLNEQWFNGTPPTYQAFADYWVQETQRRKHTKVAPKDEWKLINFLQQMQKSGAHLSQKELMSQWKQLQAGKAALAFQILESIIKK